MDQFLVGVSPACSKSMNGSQVSFFYDLSKCESLIRSVVDFTGMKPHCYGPMMMMTCGFNIYHMMGDRRSCEGFRRLIVL